MKEDFCKMKQDIHDLKNDLKSAEQPLIVRTCKFWDKDIQSYILLCSSNKRFFSFLYRPGQPNWENTMWKFQNISTTQNLREINFGHFEAPKIAILTI